MSPAHPAWHPVFTIFDAFNGTKLKANASIRQTREGDGLDKEIEHIKEQMRQMIQATANLLRLCP